MISRDTSHWSPRYLLDRTALFIYENRNPSAPWLTPDAVEILDDWLQPTDVGLEWGSGRSTRWFAARMAALVSIEHHAGWYERISRQLRGKEFEHVDYRMVPAEDEGAGLEHPYVAVVREFGEAYFDFVLVDGKYRDACALAALEAVKPGGLLVVDDANRYFRHETRAPVSMGPNDPPRSKLWSDVWEKLQSWRSFWTSSGVTDTAFFVRPPAEE